jgi:hypothetical protein
MYMRCVITFKAGNTGDIKAQSLGFLCILNIKRSTPKRI